MNTETIYGADGSKVGTVTFEGTEWVAYTMGDVEAYRGVSFLLACWTLQGRA